MCEFDIEIICKPISQPNFSFFRIFTKLRLMNNFYFEIGILLVKNVQICRFHVVERSILDETWRFCQNFMRKSYDFPFDIGLFQTKLVSFFAYLNESHLFLIRNMIFESELGNNLAVFDSNWWFSMANVNPGAISQISKHVSQKNDNFDKSRNKNLILTKIRSLCFIIS